MYTLRLRPRVSTFGSRTPAALTFLASLKWLSGFHKTWNLNLNLLQINIRIKLIAI